MRMACLFVMFAGADQGVKFRLRSYPSVVHATRAVAAHKIPHTCEILRVAVDPRTDFPGKTFRIVAVAVVKRCPQEPNRRRGAEGPSCDRAPTVALLPGPIEPLLQPFGRHLFR